MAYQNEGAVLVTRQCCQLIFKIFCQINQKIRPLEKKNSAPYKLIKVTYKGQF
jgi:hypothetical protein